MSLVEEVGPWAGTTTGLLETLNARANEATRKGPDWPRGAKKLGGELRRLAPCLRAAGIRVDIPKRRAGREKKREIRLERVGAERSARSAQAGNPTAGPENADDVRPVADHCPSPDAPQWSASNPIPGSETPIAAHAAHADRCSPDTSKGEEVIEI